MGVWAKQVLVSGVLVFMAGGARAVDNPVSTALESSLVRRGGVYYATKAPSNGTVWVSEDLMNWVPEVAAGPASSGDEALRMFQDVDGSLFSVYRKRGNKGEGEIWMQRHRTPSAAGVRSKQVLTAQRGMWDALDSANLGEPDLFGYRGNYYLLYAANQPGARTGLREIGVAMNPDLLRFSNTDKQPSPVLARNTERLARTYKSLLPSAEYRPWRARYVFKQPPADWMMPDFETLGWRSGNGGFGDPLEEDGVGITTLHTKWTSNHIWTRRRFDLPGEEPKKPVLHIRNESAVKVFLNGKKIFESRIPSTAYRNVDVSAAARGAFRPEGNVLAVQAVAEPGALFRSIDFGLSDAAVAPVEPAVYGLDAPRVVEGPNGFERWLAYRAYWNGTLGMGIDRVFFISHEMEVDGPTTSKTRGYHPPPALPTFGSSFATGDLSAWRLDQGIWKSEGGTLRQTAPKGGGKAYLQQKPAAHYLFEAGIRIPLDGSGEGGIVAYSDGKRDLVVSINPANRTWGFRVEPGSLAPEWFKWPAQFNGKAGSLHRLRITKNGERFEVMLDGFRLAAKSFGASFAGAGVPGLYGRNAAVEFDHVVYTIGWDEHGEGIIGWGAAADGTAASGEWRRSKELGLGQRLHSSTGRAFKGDLLDQYEFTVNARTQRLEEGKVRLYGVFPVFADKDNYLKAMIDTRNRTLVVSGRRNGKPVGPYSRTLARRIPLRHMHDPETDYKDVAAWMYALRSESVVTGLEIRWMQGLYDDLQQEFVVPVDDLEIRYAQLPNHSDPLLWNEGHLRTADEPKPKTQQSGRLNPVAIRPISGTHVGFGIYTASPDDTNLEVPSTISRPQEVLVDVAVESSYFFRCVKLSDRVLIELNGQPMLTVEGEWPPSQVGLLTEGQPCSFDGITRVHLPRSGEPKK